MFGWVQGIATLLLPGSSKTTLENSQVLLQKECRLFTIPGEKVDNKNKIAGDFLLTRQVSHGLVPRIRNNNNNALSLTLSTLPTPHCRQYSASQEKVGTQSLLQNPLLYKVVFDRLIIDVSLMMPQVHSFIARQSQKRRILQTFGVNDYYAAGIGIVLCVMIEQRTSFETL